MNFWVHFSHNLSTPQGGEPNGPVMGEGRGWNQFRFPFFFEEGNLEYNLFEGNENSRISESGILPLSKG